MTSPFGVRRAEATPAEPCRLAPQRRSGLGAYNCYKVLRRARIGISRIENGTVSPSWTTLERLLRRSGFELQVALVPRLQGRSHMLEDVPRILRLTPEQRLLELRNAARLFDSAVRKRP